MIGRSRREDAAITPGEFFTLAGVSVASTAAALAAAFRFVGSWSFGELSARNKVRREFAAATGTQVAALANQHYWAVANAAGTLSVGLRVYLRRVELSLYLDHPTHKDLKDDVDRVASEAAANTLLSLVRFIWALDDFQFKGSNDYLLPHYSAGRQLRRLYNEFRDAIQIEDDHFDDLAALIIKGGKDPDQRAKVETAYEADVKKLRPPARASEATDAGTAKPSPVETAPEGTDDSAATLSPVAELWRNWLTNGLPQVVAAAAVLQAFSRLLQHELADLYGDWFRDVRSDAEIDAVQDAVEQESWPGALGRRDLTTIAAVSEQIDFLSALSRATRSQKGSGDRKVRPSAGIPDAPIDAAATDGREAMQSEASPLSGAVATTLAPDRTRFVIAGNASP